LREKLQELVVSQQQVNRSEAITRHLANDAETVQSAKRIAIMRRILRRKTAHLFGLHPQLPKILNGT
jgi:hypothetical protein